MTKIDIFSGFLGAGKTTLIKKLIKEAYAGEKLVLVENEFGEIGVDGAFMKEAGITVNELNSGCICCSLVGDFSKALQQVIDTYAPDRILIEPSGVGKLSEVITAVQSVQAEGVELNTFTTVVDAGKAKMYMKNFGEFFNNQVEHANCIVFSHTDKTAPTKLQEALALIRAHNEKATVIVTPWEELDGKEILSAMEHKDALEKMLEQLKEEHEHHHHHEHHHDHDEECHCHDHEHEHHHDHDEECHCHDHEHEHHHDHHHDHDEECHCHDHEHEHEHHHEHDDDCDCGCHDHHEHHHDHGEGCTCGCHDHHHHHADEVFVSWGVETAKRFSEEELQACLEFLCDEHKYGMVLRAKGVVADAAGGFFHFDYVPGEGDLRHGAPVPVGMLCVIGAGLKEDALKALFGV
ncbi:MAG: GTP-binding protein [Clostridia bacterium]|nr:GTP-binding protein [Clostridia bacterium]